MTATHPFFGIDNSPIFILQTYFVFLESDLEYKIL